MKTKKDLQILFKIRKESVNINEILFEYQEYLKKNPIIIDSKEKLKKLRECETKLANVIIAVLNSKEVFCKSKTQLSDLKDYAYQLMDVPQKFKRYTDEKSKDGVSIIDVLRRARNWEEHPEKANQMLYRFMADEIDFQKLLELAYRVDSLSSHEIQELDQDELRKMISNSETLHSRIYSLQSELEKVKDYIFENENTTDEQRKRLQEFLEFVPDEENVILLEKNTKEESN